MPKYKIIVYYPVIEANNGTDAIRKANFPIGSQYEITEVQEQE